MDRGRVEVIELESKVLRGNALGDPHVRRLPVYLPPGYDDGAAAGRRYPLIVMLSGFTGTGAMLLQEKAWHEPLDRRMDRLIAAGRARPAIVALPDCFTRLGGSQYRDSSATGAYATYVCDEVVAAVDARFRTIAAPRGRGVMGKSSGGYGAITLGMCHTDAFGAIVCHSGDAYFEYCYVPDFARCFDELRKHGGSVEAFLAAFEAAPKKAKDALDAINIIAMSACYSPHEGAPLGFDLPFDLETGEVRPDVFTRWLALDPVRMIESHVGALLGMRLVFIDCGTRDEFRLHVGARAMARQLRALGIAHVHEEFDDGHFEIGYRNDVSIPLLTRALAEE